MEAASLRVDSEHESAKKPTPTAPRKVTLIDTAERIQMRGCPERFSELPDERAFCFTYGDGLFDVDISAQIEFHLKRATLATVKDLN